MPLYNYPGLPYSPRICIERLTMSRYFANLVIGILIVAGLVLAWAALQGIGAAFGHGIQEWLVR